MHCVKDTEEIDCKYFANQNQVKHTRDFNLKRDFTSETSMKEIEKYPAQKHTF